MTQIAPGVIVDKRPAAKGPHNQDGETIAWVTVDNRRRLNCLSSEIVARLCEVFETLSDDGSLRAVVLTGAGERAFIGGADLTELGSLDHEGGRLYITGLHKACLAIRDCPVPVIARVNGFCLGAGLEIAASCDMRVASETAIFGMPEVHMGLPSVIEAALLPGLIGWGKTREILITGETFGAQDARAMQLLQKVAAPSALDAAVDAWLDAICRAAPQAVRAQKALMNRWERTSVAEGIYAGIDALAAAYDTGEPQQRIRAFFTAKKDKGAD